MSATNPRLTSLSGTKTRTLDRGFRYNSHSRVSRTTLYNFLTASRSIVTKRNLGLRLITGLGLLLVLPYAMATAPLNLLFISSFYQDLPAQSAVETGLTASLQASGQKYNIRYEFIDGVRLGTYYLDQTYPLYLEEKYRDHPPDVLVAWSTAAIELIQQNPNLFNNARLFLLEPLETVTMAREFQGLRLRNDYECFAREAIRLSAPQKIMVIGTTEEPNAIQRLDSMQEAFLSVKPTAQIDYLLDLELTEIAERLKHADPQTTIVFYLLMFSDESAHSETPYSIAGKLASVSRAPVYTPWAVMMGTGVVGGCVFSLEAAGDELGRMINGVEDTAFSPMAMMYDQSALDKWNIATAALPRGAEIINARPDVLTLYLDQILIGAFTIFILVLAVLFLSYLLRIRAEKIKSLEQVLPICAYCKNIRDDDGQWFQLEEYLSNRSTTRFSHGICPSCYADVSTDLNEDKSN